MPTSRMPAVSEFDACLDLVTELPARLMNLSDYGIEPGNPADLIVLDTQDSRDAIAELPDVLMGFKSGRQVFERQRPTFVRAGLTDFPRLAPYPQLAR